MRASGFFRTHSIEVARGMVGDQVVGVVEKREVEAGGGAHFGRIRSQFPEDVWDLRDRGYAKRRCLRRAGSPAPLRNNYVRPV
jgi:hypothetical protein